MARRGFRGDWIDLAAALLMLAGALDVFQGVIAIVRQHYYTFSPDEVLVVDISTWGWILLFWGSIVALTGFGLWLRSSSARWFAVAIAAANIVAELGFAGGNHAPLWALTGIALSVIVLYALIAHWHGADAATA